MAITDTLSDIWHALEDKAWSLADFLEDKGVPLASFCESKGISPVFVFAGMLIAILLILALVSGGVGGATSVLTVHVTDADGNAVQTNVKVTPSSGIGQQQRADINGKATFQNFPFGSVTLEIVDQNNKYKGSATATVSEAVQTVEVRAELVKGTISLVVRKKEGGYLEKGSIDVKDLITGRVAATRQLDGSSKYDITVPVGVYKVVLKSISGGEIGSKQVDVKGDGEYAAEIEASESAASSASVRVVVSDESGAVIQGATALLKNGKNDETMGREGITDASGSFTFSNIAIGTSVYPVVFILNKRYGQLSEYESRSNPNYRITVDEILETIPVTLPLNGRVEVSVWDKESMSYISGASVYIKNKAGQTVGQTKQTDSQGKAAFAGFEENMEVYPVVSAEGYMASDDPSSAKPVSYSGTTQFGAGLQRDGSYASSMMVINATDIYGGAVSGLDAVLSEANGTLIKKLTNTGNITFAVDANKLYTVSLHKRNFLWEMLEGIGPGVKSAEMREANTANAGDVRVCTYVMINGQASPGSADIELFRSPSGLIDKLETAGGSDGSNCATFSDVPQEWSVYARATSDGYEPIETESYDVAPRGEELTLINVTFNQLPPNAAATGDIKVCVLSQSNNPVAGAEVLLYDEETDTPTWSGQYRLSTVADGCVIFTGLPIEKTNYEGTLASVRVYPIVSAAGYATYNGKAEGNILAVQPSRVTPINVRLGAGKAICIAVKSDGEAVSGVDVSLCANAPCTQVLETQATESDGHATFSSDVTSVTVKVVANEDQLMKELKKSFPLSQVTQGQCGAVDLPAVSHYATITIDGNNMLQVAPGQSNQSIDILVRVDDKLATGGSVPTGGQNMVSADDGTKVLIEITGGISAGTIQTRDAAAGKYSITFIAPSTSGTYQVTIAASIPGCAECQGDQKLITIVVGNGDSDGDGVSDQYDRCPSTPWGTKVDSSGCPSANLTDTDGDGVVDGMDTCPGTRPGLRVDSRGCEIEELKDSNNNGIPDRYESIMNPPVADANQNQIPDQWDNQQAQQGSVDVCIVDDVGAPVYDSSVILYNQGAPGSYGAGAPGSYGTGGATSSTGQTAYPTGYGQPWQGTYTRDNCRTFVGYGATASMQTSSFLTSFYLGVNAKGYEPYDSRKDGGTGLSFSSVGPGGGIRVDIQLKRGKTVTSGGGVVTNPERQVELKGASWKGASTETKSQGELYPVVTTASKDMLLSVKYSLSTPAGADFTYLVRYAASGNPCFKLADESAYAGQGGKTIAIRSGQSVVEDALTLSADENCWAANKPEIERDFTLTIDGQLMEVNGKESTSKTHFMQSKVTIKPLIGATKNVSTVSDLTKLSGMLSLSDGVVTKGALPYCMSEQANTGKSSRVSVSDGGGVSDKAAGNYKIVIEFKASQAFPATLSDLASKIGEAIRTNLRKSPADCKVYINTYNRYKGYIEVGQTGTACHDAAAPVPDTAKTAEPWQKLFCDTIASGVQQEMQLGGSYSMKIDTK